DFVDDHASECGQTPASEDKNSADKLHAIFHIERSRISRRLDALATAIRKARNRLAPFKNRMINRTAASKQAFYSTTDNNQSRQTKAESVPNNLARWSGCGNGRPRRRMMCRRLSRCLPKRW